MVVTRRSRNLHPQGGNEQFGGSPEEPLLSRQQQRPPPPPPPPPPMAQQPGVQNENVQTFGETATDNNSDDNVINQNILQSPVAIMESHENQNISNIDVDIQYLRVRVPPPTRALNFRRPFHIHRRKRYSAPTDPAMRQQPRLNDRIDNHNQTGGRKKRRCHHR